MTDHSKLKSVCEALIAHSADSFYTPCAEAFERAATPAVVLELIAEIEKLKSEKSTA